MCQGPKPARRISFRKTAAPRQFPPGIRRDGRGGPCGERLELPSRHDRDSSPRPAAGVECPPADRRGTRASTVPQPGGYLYEKTVTAGALALSLLAAPALADPAVVMAPGGPGGGYDAMARLPFQAMQEAGIFTDGAQFTNKGGAAGRSALRIRQQQQGQRQCGDVDGGDPRRRLPAEQLAGHARLHDAARQAHQRHGAVAVPPNSPSRPSRTRRRTEEGPRRVPIGGVRPAASTHRCRADRQGKRRRRRQAQLHPLSQRAEVVAAIAGGTLDARFPRVGVQAVRRRGRIASLPSPATSAWRA